MVGAISGMIRKTEKSPSINKISTKNKENQNEKC